MAARIESVMCVERAHRSVLVSHPLVNENLRYAQFLKECAVPVPQAVPCQPILDRQPTRLRPRTGTPGHGPAVTGTGCAPCGAFFGYHPVAARVKIHVAWPDLRQCAASRAGPVGRSYPSSAMTASTFCLVFSATVSGRSRTLDTVSVDTPQATATCVSVGPSLFCPAVPRPLKV